MNVIEKIEHSQIMREPKLEKIYGFVKSIIYLSELIE